MSSISASTFGGVDFDLLCRGDIQSYSFNPVDLTGERNVKQIKRKLIQQLGETVKALEFHSDRKIANIYIGKTFVKQKRKHGRGFQTFRTSDHHTWKKNGISSRWRDHRKQDYGRDGLVVLGVLTRQSLPKECSRRIHQEHLALAMEQKLLHHYLLSEPDSRVVNETFTAGNLDHGKSFAYAVYMAFSYGEGSTTMDTEELNQDASSPLNVTEDAHESASNSSPASPYPRTHSRASSDCVMTAYFSGTQKDPRLQSRPTNPSTPTSHQPHPHQQVAPAQKASSHTSLPPHTPPSPSPSPPRRKRPRNINDPIMQRFLSSLKTNPPSMK